MHVDVNIIWSHIQSQAPQHQPTPFCTCKMTSPAPPNFQVEITPLLGQSARRLWPTCTDKVTRVLAQLHLSSFKPPSNVKLAVSNNAILPFNAFQHHTENFIRLLGLIKLLCVISLVTQPSFFLGGRGTRGRGREKRTSGNYSQVFVRFSSAVPRFWHRQSDRFGKSGDRHES